MEFWVLILSCFAGAYMAWNIGANDVANGMASPVGAKAITLRQALFIGAILDFSGAVLLGAHVTSTITKGIIDIQAMNIAPQVIMLGFLAALLSASFWVFISTWSQYPVSTTHSIVGALIGVGLVEGGLKAIHWGKLGFIVMSWIVSPVFAGLVAFLIFVFIRRLILSTYDVFDQTVKWSPFFGGITFFVVFVSIFLETSLGVKFKHTVSTAILAALIIAIIVGVVTHFWAIRLLKAKKNANPAEEVFRKLQIFTACYVAFAHGANDVANAVGPLAAIYLIYKTGALAPKAVVPIWMLALGGGFIALGILMWGHRVIETVGHKITELNNTRGYSVDFGTATAVLLASKLGLPVSTTHAAVGAVIGVGLAGGLAAVDFGVVWRIISYWVVTIPLSAIPAMIILKLLKFIFL
ncbi:MAG: inorganic phosphate transporter [Thermodesulforhabdaceae bacterium]|jgi:PiT family inorganic phosphate transporter